MALQLSIIFLPLLMGFSLFTPLARVKNFLTVVYVSVLVLLSSLLFFITPYHFSFSFNSLFHTLFIGADLVLLFYFLGQGILQRSKNVTLLALLQLFLFLIVLFLPQGESASDIVVDRLTLYMYLIVNIVGGSIIVYALKYIDAESFSQRKKDLFIAMLFLFLGVMNFIVSFNNLELFFLLFETTTLFSYLLIRYRSDEISVANALRALWMNQIGGVAILIALLYSLFAYKTLYLDLLLQHSGTSLMFVFLFLALAAFVKGASLPFESWLLGAMVAPTPVSAILHSATMVKIAPFLMLKLSAGFDAFFSLVFVLLGSFVFFAASFMALGKDSFKEILGLSTIALLALMMALAALGTPEAIEAALYLMVFHALSKALLFLQAGILERELGLKYVKDIDGLMNYSPRLAFVIILGFASLTLPPFGAFAGKFLAIESLASVLKTQVLYTFALVFVALGSVLLTLLYFKVLSKVFAQDLSIKREKLYLSPYYTLPSNFLLCLLGLGVLLTASNDAFSSFEILFTFLVFVSFPLLISFFLFKKAQRVGEYNCGEKGSAEISMYYFTLKKSWITLFHFGVIIGFVLAFVGILLC